MKRPSFRWSPSVVIVAVLMVLSLGVLAGVLLVPAVAPPGVTATHAIGSVPANEVETVDGLEATMTIAATEPQKVVAPLSGTVTADACDAGRTMISGDAALTVNDATIIYLATSQPLWRDIHVGDSGTDVRSLQNELTRLGHPVEADGTFGSSTLKAVIDLARHSGADDATGWPSFPATRFAWLPSPTATPVSCDVQVGESVDAGGSIATLSQRISAAAVSPLPHDAMPGPRVVVAGDLTVPVNASGEVADPADLTRLAASSAYRSYLTGGAVAARESSDRGASASGGSGMTVRYQLAVVPREVVNAG